LTPECILELHSRLFAADCKRALSGPVAHNRFSAQVFPALIAASIVGVASFAPGSNEARGSELRAASTGPAVPKTPPPLLLRNLTREEAIRTNQLIAFSRFGNVPAPPFHFTGDKTARARALSCLTAAVYYEAASESEEGQEAVAQVVLNRARNSAFPGSICAVVFQGSTLPTGCQFSFTCDGSLERVPLRSAWKAAQDVAEAALSGRVFAPVGLSTHYHADYVVPYWASTLAKNAVVGAHIFYRWAGGWGQPAAFNEGYAGHEPNARALRNAALAAVHVTANTPSSVAQAIKDIPGAEPIKLQPSMRGDKRVAVRFNLVARKASDEAKHEDYEQKFEASDNLKWALSGDTVAENQAPLGKAAATSGGAGAQTGQH